MAKSVAHGARPAKKAKTRQPPRMLARAQVPPAVKAMAAPTGTDRFRAGKALCVTVEKDPARVYPLFDAIAPLLASESKIVRWNAIRLLASLAPADAAHKLDAHLDTFVGFIRGSNLISAANAIQGLSMIGRARPDLLDRIVPAILEVERATYETPECRNVAIGQALDALQALWPSVRSRPDVTAFVRRQQTNPRAAVARRAKKVSGTFS